MTKIYSVTEAARLADRSTQAICLALRRKRLKGRKIGKVWIILKPDFEAWYRLYEHETRGRRLKERA